MRLRMRLRIQFYLTTNFQLAKCAELKVAKKLILTPTEAFVWNKLRMIMANPDSHSSIASNCVDFDDAEKRRARCCLISLKKEKVMYCTYCDLLETKAVSEIPPKETCDCKQTSPSSGSGTGKCYFMPSKQSNYCTEHTCKPSFECVSNKTGLKCLRRKEAFKIIPVAQNMCVKKRSSLYTYVPYTTY